MFHFLWFVCRFVISVIYDFRLFNKSNNGVYVLQNMYIEIKTRVIHSLNINTQIDANFIREQFHCSQFSKQSNSSGIFF